MGFMDWLMKNVGFENEEVYDDSIEKEKRYEEKKQQQEEKRRRKEEIKALKAREKADRAAARYSLRQEKDVSSRPDSTTTSYAENPSQYNISANTSYSSPMNNYGLNSNVGGYGTKNVEFLYPTKFDDVEVVINYLKEGETVMLNLNSMNEYDSQRLLDCTSGAVHALNGSIRHVDSNIFLVTPEGFSIKTPDDNRN